MGAYTLFGGLMLLGGRIAQGVGAAMLSPAALSVYINVPIGLVSLAVLSRLLPALPAAGRSRLDVPGAPLVTAATATAIYALINAGDRGWLTAATLGTLAAAAVLYATFARWQRTTRAPLMDLQILARRPVAAGTFLILVATALMIAVFFLGSFYLQHRHGYGALRTGLLFLPVAVATMLGASTAGRVIGRLGARPLALAGLGTAAVGMAVPSLWAGPGAMLGGISVAAAGIGATFAAVISSIAGASIVGTAGTGFTRGFAAAAVTAAVAGALAAIVVPTAERSAQAVPMQSREPMTGPRTAVSLRAHPTRPPGQTSPEDENEVRHDEGIRSVR